MTEKPILFSSPMIVAILNGSKSQTRREIKPGRLERKPYKVGMHHWVRETWNVFAVSRDDDVSWPLKKIPATDPRLDEDRRVCVDYPVASLPGSDGGKGPWRPGIHMPRWASRITLAVTEVRSQRLQEISEEDAKAEGIGGAWSSYYGDGYHCSGIEGTWSFTAQSAYRKLWVSINGTGSWEVNPLVWAISFERIAQEAKAA